MSEYTFEIDFTSNDKEFTSKVVIEHNKLFGPGDLSEMLIEAFKGIFSRHPTANNIKWKLL